MAKLQTSLFGKSTYAEPINCLYYLFIEQLQIYILDSQFSG